MSDSGESRDSGRLSVSGPDMRMTSLTVGQFWQQVEAIELRTITLVQLRGTVRPITIWSDGNPLNMNEYMEEFLNCAVLDFNQRQRANNCRTSSPVIKNGAVTLDIILTSPGRVGYPGGPSTITVEYTLRSGYQIRYR